MSEKIDWDALERGKYDYDNPEMYYIPPAEVWSAAQCAKKSKARGTDGYGSKHPHPGLVQGSGEPFNYYGPQKYNGGITIDGKWYHGTNRPWPIIPPEYEFYNISSRGTFIRLKP